jgi:hypothetical protein
MRRLREWYQEGRYWTGRWVGRRLDSAMKKYLDRLNRD